MSKLLNNLFFVSFFSQNSSAVFQSRLGVPEYFFQSLNQSLHHQLSHWLQQSLCFQAPASYHFFESVILQEQSQLRFKNLCFLDKQSFSVFIHRHSYNQELQFIDIQSSQASTS